MRRRVLIVAAAVVLLVAAGLAAYFLLGGQSVDDPQSARCNSPAPVFGSERAGADHRELDVTFTCEGTRIAGTLNLPNGEGPFPAIVMVHAAGEATGWTWNVPFVQAFVPDGFAVLGYDKRGVGESDGECCPGDDGHFNLLAADADGGVNALRTRADIDETRVGLFGISQAG